MRWRGHKKASLNTQPVRRDKPAGFEYGDSPSEPTGDYHGKNAFQRSAHSRLRHALRMTFHVTVQMPAIGTLGYQPSADPLVSEAGMPCTWHGPLARELGRRRPGEAAKGCPKVRLFDLGGCTSAPGAN